MENKPSIFLTVDEPKPLPRRSHRLISWNATTMSNDPFDMIGMDYGSAVDWKSPMMRFRYKSDVFSSHDSIGGLGSRTVDDMIFDYFKSHRDDISVAKFLVALRSAGLKKNDPRLGDMIKKFHVAQRERLLDEDVVDPYNLVLDRETFKACIRDSLVLITRALRGQFVIPDWPEFTRQIEQIFNLCKPITEGKVADYIPQLARASPDSWGVAVCTVDGQRASWGDYKLPWCLQSVSKPLTYGIALHEYGSEVVHSYVGQEPSGRLFNEICLDYNARPHNPLINAGAIIVTSLIKSEEKLADRFEFLLKKYKAMAGDEFVGFSNTTFLSERETADRNNALAYYLREHKCFPKEAAPHLKQTLDLYFQACSVDVTCESASVIAATLANGGVCPMTNEKVLGNRAVRDVLSLMYSCGMYDYSGQFAFNIGLPAKSGVSGAMIIVIPNVMGFAVWSPPLDKLGNTVRGVAFSRELIETFNFHNYDNLVHGDSHKIDPRKRITESLEQQLVNLLFSAASGDLNSIKRYTLSGISLDVVDYDGRTALHLAASEGRSNVVKFLTNQCRVRADIKDRWSRTALDDAKQFGHAECVKIIEDYLEELAQSPLGVNDQSSLKTSAQQRKISRSTTPIPDQSKTTLGM